jgi:hypothetical protein
VSPRPLPGLPKAAIATSVLLGLVACTGEHDVTPEGGAPDGDAAVFVMPRDTDILLAQLTWEGDDAEVSAPTNVTQRPDYDNQPYFVPDGSGFWYTVNDPHDGQADIWRYSITSHSVTRVTMSSPESEYSATPLPDGSGISTIRVEADSTQRLWRFDHDGSNAAVLLADVAPVGYHAWSGYETLVMFVLGQPATLQRARLGEPGTDVIAQNIGRSIQKIPGSEDVSYQQLDEAGGSTIMRLPSDGDGPQPLAESVPGGDYHAWAPNGLLLQASGSVIWSVRPGPGATWQPLVDWSDLRVTLTRLAVSPDGSQIAVVAEPAPLEGFAGN